jgi:hypothetical protein
MGRYADGRADFHRGERAPVERMADVSGVPDPDWVF